VNEIGRIWESATNANISSVDIFPIVAAQSLVPRSQNG
jgi:hypothetical protein